MGSDLVHGHKGKNLKWRIFLSPDDWDQSTVLIGNKSASALCLLLRSPTYKNGNIPTLFSIFCKNFWLLFPPSFYDCKWPSLNVQTEPTVWIFCLVATWYYLVLLLLTYVLCDKNSDRYSGLQARSMHVWSPYLLEANTTSILLTSSEVWHCLLGWWQ